MAYEMSLRHARLLARVQAAADTCAKRQSLHLSQEQLQRPRCPLPTPLAPLHQQAPCHARGMSLPILPRRQPSEEHKVMHHLVT